MDIGDTDFQMVAGHTLIESGTFRSQKVGRAFAETDKSLGASIGFKRPVTEPDDNGVFHNIDIFERSLLPLDEAANRLTGLAVLEA